MTVKKIAILLTALLILALAAGCSNSAASSDAQVDSIRVIKLNWSHPEPDDENTWVVDDADEIQKLIAYFNELDCTEKFENRDEMYAEYYDRAGDYELDVDLMSNGSSVKHYIMHGISGPLFVQFEPDGEVYQMSEENWIWWYEFFQTLRYN